MPWFAFCIGCIVTGKDLLDQFPQSLFTFRLLEQIADVLPAVLSHLERKINPTNMGSNAG